MRAFSQGNSAYCDLKLFNRQQGFFLNFAVTRPYFVIIEANRGSNYAQEFHTS